MMSEECFSDEVVDRIVKASQYIIMCEPSNNEPVNYGCGFIVKYRERLFLLTVKHLIGNLEQPPSDLEQPSLLPCIDLDGSFGLNNGVLSTPLFNVGAGNMHYFDEYKKPKEFKDGHVKIESFQELEKLGFSFSDHVDIAVCILNEKYTKETSVQPPYEKGFTYGRYDIKEGNRIYIDLDIETSKPNMDKKYGLYGRIK